MALTGTLYRFRIQLSDVDRGVYEELDLRTMLHPSETPVFLAARILAYALEYREGLEFSPGGVSDTEQPAILARAPGGAIEAWVEIGAPSARKLRKALGAARDVAVYVHRDPAALARELEELRLPRGREIRAYAIEPRLLAALAETLERDNEWLILRDGAGVTAGPAEGAASGELKPLS